ncbi:major facilitator superfamily domain-containing protein [Leptodontidium sp. MPI-SDFR-AT-0119]|nr:major facilitator superfamily domain-containing protein [Leptodontidium sp. MPI-SDFR-AT-0119]
MSSPYHLRFLNMTDKEMTDLRMIEFVNAKSTSRPSSTHGQAPIDDEVYRRTEKRLVRKLDLTLMPMVWILYMFNYLDRNNIASAKLKSFEKDLGLKGNQFNTAVSILNVGYMLMQLPSNMILTRVRPSLYLPFWVCIWSCVSAATAAARSYSDLIVIRFFLGIAEAPFFLGELALRTAILYTGLVLATAFSGLIAAGIFAGMDGVHGHAAWRWLFIIKGVASFGLGIVAAFILPDFPETNTSSSKWLLRDDEQQVAIERMKRDRYSLRLAAADYRMWIFVVMLIANHTAYGFNYFYPSIVKGLNLGSTTITLVLTAPPYLVATVSAMIVAWSSDRMGERGYHICIPMSVAAVGFIISTATLNTAVRYFASFLYIGGCFSANAMVFSWAASTLSQTPEKRAISISIINLLSQLGNIWSPYFFRPGDASRYVLAMSLMIAFALLSVVTCLAMKVSLKRANKKILEEYQEGEDGPTLFPL